MRDYEREIMRLRKRAELASFVEEQLLQLKIGTEERARALGLLEPGPGEPASVFWWILMFETLNSVATMGGKREREDYNGVLLLHSLKASEELKASLEPDERDRLNEVERRQRAELYRVMKPKGRTGFRP